MLINYLIIQLTKFQLLPISPISCRIMSLNTSPKYRLILGNLHTLKLDFQLKRVLPSKKYYKLHSFSIIIFLFFSPEKSFPRLSATQTEVSQRPTTNLHSLLSNTSESETQLHRFQKKKKKKTQGTKSLFLQFTSLVKKKNPINQEGKSKKTFTVHYTKFYQKIMMVVGSWVLPPFFSKI